MKKCYFTEASSLVFENLLGHNKTSQLKSCYFRNRLCFSGLILYEPIPLYYRVQESLVNLQIDLDDMISLKNLLQYLPNLITLGM